MRLATVEDIPDLVEMGRKFHAMSPHRFMGEYDPDAVGRVLKVLIEHPDGIVVTNGQGCIGGFVTPVYFAPEKRQAEESFWFSASGGKDLREMFEAEAKKIGADFVLMSGLENDRSRAIHRTFRMAGYVPVERRYVKEL